MTSSSPCGVLGGEKGVRRGAGEGETLEEDGREAVNEGDWEKR